MNAIEGWDQTRFPGRITPMLAREVRTPFNREGVVFEPKWDGIRGLASIRKLRKNKVDLYTRNKNDTPDPFSHIVANLSEIPHDVVLDGEIVIFDEYNKPNFDYIRQYRGQKGKKPGRQVYCAFDLLYIDSYNLLDVPLIERKGILQELLPNLPHLAYTEHLETYGIDFFNAIREQGLEGMVAKKMQSNYRPGVRSREWIKIKSYVRHGWKKQIER